MKTEHKPNGAPGRGLCLRRDAPGRNLRDLGPSSVGRRQQRGAAPAAAASVLPGGFFVGSQQRALGLLWIFWGLRGFFRKRLAGVGTHDKLPRGNRPKCL